MKKQIEKSKEIRYNNNRYCERMVKSMRGGTREGAGRKCIPNSDKKKAEMYIYQMNKLMKSCNLKLMGLIHLVKNVQN